LIFTG